MIRASGRTRTSSSARRGFSMPELLAAVVIMSVGVLGLASTAAVMARQVNGGARQSVAAQVAESRFEAMRGRSCASLVAGTATTRGVAERWTFTPGGNNTVRATVDVSFTDGATTRTRTYRSGITC